MVVDNFMSAHTAMQAAEFLIRRTAAQPAHCRLLCDDDNDLSEPQPPRYQPACTHCQFDHVIFLMNVRRLCNNISFCHLRLPENRQKWYAELAELVGHVWVVRFWASRKSGLP